MTEALTYDKRFFRQFMDGSSRSASIVVPIIVELLDPKSVVDIGCGVAPWAAAFKRAGVKTVMGMDGDYVDRSLLQIAPEQFKPTNLDDPITLNQRFDLAVCLEVAEHLPPKRAESLVDDLFRLAPSILFSAAIPGQGGTHHVNEQHLDYWTAKFKARGYVALDAVRPMILGDDRVEWWYQQNIVLAVAADHPLTERFAEARPIVHRHIYDYYRRHEDLSLGRLAALLAASTGRAVRRRLPRL